MTDYSWNSVHEAASQEMCRTLVQIIKQMDEETVVARFSRLLNTNYDSPFLQVVGEFNSLFGHKTSADV